VLGLSCAELGNSLWPLYFMPAPDSAACTAQALTLQFFSFASILWSAAIAWTLNAAMQTGGPGAGAGGGGGGGGVMSQAVGPGRICSPRHRTPFHLPQEARVQMRGLDDMAGHVYKAL